MDLPEPCTQVSVSSCDRKAHIPIHLRTLYICLYPYVVGTREPYQPCRSPALSVALSPGSTLVFSTGSPSPRWTLRWPMSFCPSLVPLAGPSSSLAMPGVVDDPVSSTLCCPPWAGPVGLPPLEKILWYLLTLDWIPVGIVDPAACSQ